MNGISSRIVRRIDFLLKSQSLTRQVLADNIGISASSIANWKNRNSIPAVDTLYSIAKFLGVSIDFLISDDTGITDRQAETIAKYKKLPESASESVNIFIDGLYNNYKKEMK